MSDKNFCFYLFTRELLAEIQKLTELVDVVKRLVNLDTALFIDQTSKSQTRLLPYTAANQVVVTENLRKGEIFVTGPNEQVFQLVLGEVGKFSYFSLFIDEALLKSESWVENFLDFAHQDFEKFAADFAFAFLAQPPGYDCAYMASEDSLELGLRDTYWLNILGPEFCELIGYKKLLAAPSYSTKLLHRRSVSIVCSPDPREVFDKSQLREYIGNQYFSTPQTRPIAKGKDETGLWALTKHLFTIALDKGPEIRKAELSPKFPRKAGTPIN